jgi:methylthioribulose-1-phosphate dehydratase
MRLPLAVAIQELIAIGRRLDARGLAPATSGNFSARVDAQRIAITVSGSHKGRLSAADLMLVDLAGRALEDRAPSAEAPLHTALYQRYPDIDAVLHIHSVAAVALTRYLPDTPELALDGYEMLKALPGIRTHEARVVIPILENSQDTVALAQLMLTRLRGAPPASAVLIRGHGLYAWGGTVGEAERIVEAMEHLMACELQLLQLPHRGAG